MAHRSVHYEAAFEDYLRGRSWPYVAVDEAKKAALISGLSIKSFDFIVYSTAGTNLLVDIKGRKFPDISLTGRHRGGRAWENWITREDADGLGEWEKIFGDGFKAVLVFAYWLAGPPHRAPFEDIHLFRERHYSYLAVDLQTYLAAAKARSSRWGTLGMPAKAFKAAAKEFASIL